MVLWRFEGVGEEGVTDDRLSADEMVLDDFLEDLGCAALVPGAFRIDDRDRAADADLEAVGLGAGDAGEGTDEVEFLETALEVIPGFLTGGGVAALGLGGRGAQEDVALHGGKAVSYGHRRRRVHGQGIRHGTRIRRVGSVQSAKTRVAGCPTLFWQGWGTRR